jgi:polar amino acid transport system substrate-binding protein
MYTVARTQEREKLFKWVGPVIEGRVYMYKLKENDKVKIKTIGDLRLYSTAVLRGGAVEAHLISQGFADNDFVKVTYSEQLVPMLFANRVDLIPGDESDLLFQVAQSGREAKNIEKAFLLYKRDYYIALNLETPDEVVEQLQTSLDKIVESGERERITRRYHP